MKLIFLILIDKSSINKVSSSPKGESERSELKFRCFNIKKLESSPKIIDRILTPDCLTFDKVKDQELQSFFFNILAETNIIEKQRFVWSILEQNGFIEEFLIPINTLCDFIDVMKNKYNKRRNPFHNFDHGVSGFYYN